MACEQPAEPNDAIDDALASGLKKAQWANGNMSYEQHSADDLIKLDQYDKSREKAVKAPLFGIRMSRLVPPAGGRTG